MPHLSYSERSQSSKKLQYLCHLGTHIIGPPLTGWSPKSVWAGEMAQPAKVLAGKHASRQACLLDLKLILGTHMVEVKN